MQEKNSTLEIDPIQIRDRKLPHTITKPIKFNYESNDDFFLEFDILGDFPISDYMSVTPVVYKKSTTTILSDGAIMPETGILWKIDFRKVFRQKKNEPLAALARRLDSVLIKSFGQLALIIQDFQSQGG